MKLGFTAWVTSEETRKELANVLPIRSVVCSVLAAVLNEATARSIVSLRKLLLAPCRSPEPISSSSNRPTIFIMELSFVWLLKTKACTAAQEQSLSSAKVVSACEELRDESG